MQSQKRTSPTHQASTASLAAQIPVVVVGTAAKMTWVTTKFTTEHLAGPVAKTVLIKATPAITKFALRNAVRYGVPFAARLSLL